MPLYNPSPGVVPCFSAHKNGTDQTGVTSATFTQVTFSTTLYNIGNNFASNAWTPPAGKVHLNATVAFSHNQLGTLANRGANGTGILIDAGAGDYYSIIGNDVNGATTGITDNGTGTHARIESNNGHNPPGAAAIGVGASPFTYTAGHYHESIYVNGGTVSIVATSGGNMFSQTNCTIHLGPNESMTVTYSVLPTMTRVRH